MVKKTTNPEVKKETVVEEKVVDNTPKRYYVDFYLKREPLAKDEILGTIFYSDEKEDMIIEGIVSNYSAKIELLLQGDITFMDGNKQVFVSRYEALKDWVLNLHRATITDTIYASEARIINETE